MPRSRETTNQSRRQPAVTKFFDYYGFSVLLYTRLFLSSPELEKVIQSIAQKFLLGGRSKFELNMGSHPGKVEIDVKQKDESTLRANSTRKSFCVNISFSVICDSQYDDTFQAWTTGPVLSFVSSAWTPCLGGLWSLSPQYHPQFRRHPFHY
jgi:hypothetical protein